MTYISDNAIYNTKKYGRIYLIQLYPNDDRDTVRKMMSITDGLRLELDHLDAAGA